MDTEFLRYKFCDGGRESCGTEKNYRIGIRHVQLIYMFSCMAVTGLVRGGTVIGVLAMADSDRVGDNYIEIFPWSPSMQGTLITSFLLGYAMMLMPADLYLRRVNSKFLVTAVLFTNGVLNVAMPTIAKKGGFFSVCNSMFILGMTQACMAPANMSLLERWLPPAERKVMSGVIFSGLQLGQIFSFPLFSTLASAPLGWELVFYSLAMMTLAASAVWVMLTSDSPGDHPAIGENEAEYIQEAMKGMKNRTLSPPWRAMLRSPALWATTLAHISTNAVFVLLLVDAPLYVKYALKMPFQESGWYLMLPFTLVFLTFKTISPTVQWVFHSGFINYVFKVDTFRKALNGFGTIGAVLSLISLSYFGPDSSTVAVAALSVALTMTAFQYTGFLENHKDMSENFSGSLLTISSAVSSAVGALLPIISGAILNSDVSDLRHWRVIFLSLASVSLICNTLYTVLGSSERQYWDHPVHKAKFGYHNDVNHLELEELKMKKPISEEEDLF